MPPHPRPPESEESNQDTLFLADECAFTQTVRMMRAAGCTVHRVQDLGMAGAPDAEVYQAALDKEAVLVTTDRGFGDIRSYPPSSHHGVIVLNVSPDPGQVRAAGVAGDASKIRRIHAGDASGPQL